MSRLANDINSAIPTARTIADLENALGYYPVLAMLNTKYIVIDGNSLPLTYGRRLGNAMVRRAVPHGSGCRCRNGNSGSHRPAREAVIYDPDLTEGSVAEYPGASRGRIVLTEYSPDRLKYDVTAPVRGLAVFSEIYYPAGWKAFIDGKEAPILRADYSLRALLIDEGDHDVEFVYDPVSFSAGRNISLASSLIIILMLAGCILYSILYAHKRKQPR